MKTKIVLKICAALASVLALSCSEAENKLDIPDPECFDVPAPKMGSYDVIAQANNLAEIGLDVVFRDFPADHPGFEEFDVGASPRQCAGSDGNDNTHTSMRDQICVTGNSPSDRYIYCDEGGTPLYYGQDDCDNARGRRGYTNGPDKTISNQCWQNPVYVTRGMVQSRLDYSQCSGEEKGSAGTIDEAIKGRYCARPMPAEGSRCYGSSLHEWFTDGGAARRIDDIITLNKVVGSSLYKMVYDYNTRVNWNGYGEDNGFFPLDKYDGDPNNYGKQSYNIWCWKKSIDTYALPDECNRWLNGNSARSQARNPDWASDYVNNRGGNKAKWHNYGFTMAGSTEFMYQQGAGDKFDFIGDDDMWIFIDGELVADLGGAHLSAPAKINIDEIADARGWSNGSRHVINFFYADRQTDGSNIMLQMSITDLKPPKFGEPRILSAKSKVNQSTGKTNTNIYVSTKLDETFLSSLVSSGVFPFVVQISGRQVLGYKVESIEYDASCSKGSYGYKYAIKGMLCSNAACAIPQILNSDSFISFNGMPADFSNEGLSVDASIGLQSEDWYIKSDSGVPASTLFWVNNALE